MKKPGIWATLLFAVLIPSLACGCKKEPPRDCDKSGHVWVQAGSGEERCKVCGKYRKEVEAKP